MLVINIFAGPDNDQSAFMAELYARLKRSGSSCTMIPSLASAWNGQEDQLDHLYMLGHHHYMLKSAASEFDCAITDAPLLLAAAYPHNMTPAFNQLAFDTFNEFDNVNFYIIRTVYGDTMDTITTKHHDTAIQKLLLGNNIKFRVVPAGLAGVDIAEAIVGKIL